MSNLTIVCPNCRAQSLVPEIHAAKTIRCPTCRHEFKLGAREVVTPTVMAAVPIDGPTNAPPVAGLTPTAPPPQRGPDTNSPFHSDRRKAFDNSRRKKHKETGAWEPLTGEEHMMFRIGIFMVGGGVAACLTPFMDVETRGIVALIAQVGPIAGTLIGLAGAALIAFGAQGRIYSLPMAGVGSIAVLACAALAFLSSQQQPNYGSEGNGFEYERVGGIKMPKRIEKPPRNHNPIEIPNPPKPELGDFPNPFSEPENINPKPRRESPFDMPPIPEHFPEEAKAQYEEHRKRMKEMEREIRNRAGNRQRGSFFDPNQ